MDRPTIVCVDDESSILAAVRTQLRDHLGAAYDIETALSGSEALELIDELIEDSVAIPLVVSDEIMPEMRGHLFLQEVHKRLPETRTVLMTGQAGLDAVVFAVNNANLFHYIPKPWASLDLLLTVDRALESHAATIERKRRVETFHRFVPSEFLSFLGVEDPIEVRAGLSREANVTVLFTDLCSFSGMAEQASPSTVLTTLNLVFGVVVPVIESCGGIVDKFIGDAVMALFQEPADGVDAAVAMLQAVDGLDTPLGKVRVGVGLHHGRAILGTVGTAERLDTTAIGDVVNTAARAEGMTRNLGTRLLCTSAIAESVPHPMRFLGRHRVKGRRQKVGFYEPLAIYPPAHQEVLRTHLQQFDAAVRDADNDAVPPFTALDRYLDAVPSDRSAQSLMGLLHRRSTPS